MKNIFIPRKQEQKGTKTIKNGTGWCIKDAFTFGEKSSYCNAALFHVSGWRQQPGQPAINVVATPLPTI